MTEVKSVTRVLSEAGVYNLTADSTPDEKLQAIEAAAKILIASSASPALISAVRSEITRALKQIGDAGAARTFDAAVSSARGTSRRAKDAEFMVVADVEPADRPVDGAALISSMITILERYLSLPRGASGTIALWCLATWCVERFNSVPYLAFLSATKGSGKTTALELISLLSRRAVMATEVTTATLFRMIDLVAPTLIWDEAERLGGKGSEESIAILNAGNRRGTGVPRCTGDDHDIEMFFPFGFKAFGAIGTIDHRVNHRSIVVPMVRARTVEQDGAVILLGEHGQRLQRWVRTAEVQSELESVRRQAARWAMDNATAVSQLVAQEPMRAWLGQRGSDNWAPLFAVAAVCGDRYYKAALNASQDLAPSQSQEDEDDPTELLLKDVSAVLAEAGHPENVPTSRLISMLCADAHRPWLTFCGGRQITPHMLAKMLRRFGVRPHQWRVGNVTERGYRWSEIKAVLERYAMIPTLHVSPGQAGHAPQIERSVAHVPDVTDTQDEEDSVFDFLMDVA